MDAERALIERVLSGDRNAFRDLIETYQSLVVHVVFRLVDNPADREEMCQDVFVKVYQHLGKFEYKARLSTWIARIAYHHCLNYLKKKKVALYDDLAESGNPREGEAGLDRLPGDAGMDTEMDDRELGDILRREIDRLPAQQRAVLTLYHLEGFSYAEIADILELPEGTVKSHLFRARNRLKEGLIRRHGDLVTGAPAENAQ